MRYRFIKAEKANYPVTVLCSVMGVGRSAFYAYLRRKPKAEEARLTAKVKILFNESGKSYGARRISEGLREDGEDVGRFQAGRLMKKAEIEVRRRKKYRLTTDSKHSYAASPNLLKRRFDVEKPNSVWCSDITYLWTKQGWMYLAVVIDLSSRKIVGWAMSKRINTKLVVDALKLAVWLRRPAKGLIFHSDRGRQYASGDFRKLLKNYKIIQSMSRKGDCWDNAVVERFFRSLKSERTNWNFYKTIENLKRDVFDYIEMFYNSKRLHSYLGYKSPAAYEKQAFST